MELPVSNKLKRCSVKLNRLAFVGSSPEEIQEQILDQRVRRCSVRLQRCSEIKLHLNYKAITDDAVNASKYKMKRCCIRVLRLNLARSEISSSRTNSVIMSENNVDFEAFEEDQDL